MVARRASYRATETEARRLEAILAADPDIKTYAAYVGNGSPRYYLSLDQQLFRTNFAQFVILTEDVAARDRAIVRVRKALEQSFRPFALAPFARPWGLRLLTPCNSGCWAAIRRN